MKLLILRTNVGYRKILFFLYLYKSLYDAACNDEQVKLESLPLIIANITASRDVINFSCFYVIKDAFFIHSIADFTSFYRSFCKL